MNAGLIVFLIAFLLIFIIKIPIPLGLITASSFYFIVTGADLRLVASKTLGQYYSNYVIIAVPLFIFAANIMNETKVTDKIFDFSKCIVGRFYGGLGHVNVLASLIFSDMTGSALADAAGLGKMEIEAMRKEGYDDGFSCAITAASATIGPIFPPSQPMLIYAMTSSTSVGALFMAGMVPGVLLALALMIYIALIARKRGYPRSTGSTSFRHFLRSTFSAIPALLTPVILLMGIYTGVMTPTEAGAIAAFYAILIGFFMYRTLTLEGMKKVFIDTVKGTGTVSLMIGAAASVSYIVAKEGIAASAAEFVMGVTDNPYIFLLIVNIIFLGLGMIIDVSVINLVFVPIILPVVKLMDIDLVHFGVMIVFNMMIGLSTPPFGMLLFITSGISGTSLKYIVQRILPMIVVMLIVLVIITYFPPVVLTLPRLFLDYAG